MGAVGTLSGQGRSISRPATVESDVIRCFSVHDGTCLVVRCFCLHASAETATALRARCIAVPERVDIIAAAPKAPQARPPCAVISSAKRLQKEYAITKKTTGAMSMDANRIGLVFCAAHLYVRTPSPCGRPNATMIIRPSLITSRGPIDSFMLCWILHAYNALDQPTRLPAFLKSAALGCIRCYASSLHTPE